MPDRKHFIAEYGDTGETYGPFDSLERAVRCAGLEEVALNRIGVTKGRTQLQMLEPDADGRDDLQGDLIDMGWSFLEISQPTDFAKNYLDFHNVRNVETDVEYLAFVEAVTKEGWS